MKRFSATQADEAMDRIRELVQPGDVLYTITRHVSRSGMMRVIDVVKLTPEGRDPYRHLGYDVALALGWSYDDRHEGVRVSGVGMDMGFHLVYTLASCLWPGYESPTDDQGQRKPHTQTGGYALKQSWL